MTKAPEQTMRLSETTGMLRRIAEAEIKLKGEYYCMVDGKRTVIQGEPMNAKELNEKTVAEALKLALSAATLLQNNPDAEAVSMAHDDLRRALETLGHYDSDSE